MTARARPTLRLGLALVVLLLALSCCAAAAPPPSTNEQLQPIQHSEKATPAQQQARMRWAARVGVAPPAYLGSPAFNVHAAAQAEPAAEEPTPLPLGERPLVPPVVSTRPLRHTPVVPPRSKPIEDPDAQLERIAHSDTAALGVQTRAPTSPQPILRRGGHHLPGAPQAIRRGVMGQPATDPLRLEDDLSESPPSDDIEPGTEYNNEQQPGLLCPPDAVRVELRRVRIVEKGSVPPRLASRTRYMCVTLPELTATLQRLRRANPGTELHISLTETVPPQAQPQAIVSGTQPALPPIDEQVAQLQRRVNVLESRVTALLGLAQRLAQRQGMSIS